MDDEADACMDAGGTIPWMESVGSSLDAYTDVGGRKRPEQVFEQRPRAKHDSRDGGGRKASGTAFEDARSKKRSLHDSLPLRSHAFSSSLLTQYH